MSGTAARHRKEAEPSPPSGVAAAIARLERASGEMGGLLDRMKRRDGEIAVAAARIAEMPPECPSAEQLALLGDKIGARQELQTEGSISLAAHWAEARQILEEIGPQLATLYEAGVAEGRRREAAELAAQSRPSRARTSHRKQYLKAVPGIPGTAVRAAVAAGVVTATLGGGIAAVHEESSVGYAATAPRPAAITVHAGRPDTAVLVPRPRTVLPSARPSAAVASASPAPVVKPSPSAPASTPPAPVPAPSAVVPPALSVARILDLGDSIRGELTLTAGPDAVTWTATTTGGITLSQSAGVLVPGQAVTLEVLDAPGDGGWVYVSFGGTTVPVHVTSGLGAPLGL